MGPRHPRAAWSPGSWRAFLPPTPPHGPEPPGPPCGRRRCVTELFTACLWVTVSAVMEGKDVFYFYFYFLRPLLWSWAGRLCPCVGLRRLPWPGAGSAAALAPDPRAAGLRWGQIWEPVGAETPRKRSRAQARNSRVKDVHAPEAVAAAEPGAAAGPCSREDRDPPPAPRAESPAPPPETRRDLGGGEGAATPCGTSFFSQSVSSLRDCSSLWDRSTTK